MRRARALRVLRELRVSQPPGLTWQRPPVSQG